jgi:ferrous iron transport protein B
MSSCCDTCSLPKRSHGPACGTPSSLDGARRFTIALAGNPNSGKTTVFNALTGLRQKVGNYPGVTVERKMGLVRLPDGTLADVIDLPGMYSMVSRSPDERVAMEVLRGLRADTPAPDVVVAVIDASNLQRNLYLVSQLIEMERPLVVALNMTDVAERRGIGVDAGALARSLGVPVIPVVGHKRQGIRELVHAIREARVAPVPDWPLPEIMKREVLRLCDAIARSDDHDEEILAEPSNGDRKLRLASASGPAPAGRSRATAERILTGDFAEDVRGVRSRAPVAAMFAIVEEKMRAAGIDPVQADIEAHYHWIETVAAECAANGNGNGNGNGHGTGTGNGNGGNGAASIASAAAEAAPAPVHLSERVDAVLIHRVWGLVLFAGIMGAMFASMFLLAKPLQDALSGLIASLGSAASSFVPGEALRSLVRDGIFAGVGSVIVFVPQIAILFLFLAVLEDSGYLARAAFLMDRLLAKVGLHGKSFIPLLSGFACAIPAIMATRTIEHRRDRLATILVLPFMTCSARLPIYGLLVGTFFAGLGAVRQAGIMLALYALGIAFAAGAAFLFRRTLLRGADSGFILELPTYKVPQPSVVGRQVLSNSSKFLTRAGTTIFAICLVLWAIAYYPRLPASEAGRLADANAISSAQRAYSVAGRLGHAIEPGIRPLGFDWKMGVGCIGAFAAREVFVSTMAIVYGAGGEEKDGKPLGAAMQADRYPDGRRVWTPLVAVSLLLWFVLAMQCLSTVMVVRQETGGWRWPLFMLAYMNALAYGACFLFYQIGSRVFGG